MRLHPQGFGPLAATLAILVILAVLLNVAFPGQTPVHYVLYTAGLAFYILCIRFFRRPLRAVEVNPSHVLSAADGHVVVIEEIFEDEFFHDHRIQVSVFMTPFNVHVNWYPISGEIIHTKYFKGAHIPAYRPKASKKNERMSIVISDENNRQVMMVQIAGLVARRVFTNAIPGTYAFQGEEAGIIKFGSRVDLILPKNAEILVEIGQNVRACETVIAKF